MQIELSGDFWKTVVEHFDEIRGPNGEPSLTDFKTIDLPIIKKALGIANPNIKHGFHIYYIKGKLKPLYLLYCTANTNGNLKVVHTEIDEQLKFNK